MTSSFFGGALDKLGATTGRLPTNAEGNMGAGVPLSPGVPHQPPRVGMGEHQPTFAEGHLDEQLGVTPFASNKPAPQHTPPATEGSGRGKIGGTEGGYKGGKRLPRQNPGENA